MLVKRDVAIYIYYWSWKCFTLLRGVLLFWLATLLFLNSRGKQVCTRLAGTRQPSHYSTSLYITCMTPLGREGSRGQYHGGRRPSGDNSFHSPTVISLSAPVKPSIMRRYHRQQTTRWGVTACSPTMVTLHDTQFVECRWWNDGWTLKTVITWW